ncbi:MAG: ferrous iron transport protein A [Bacteroidetes bacterium]|nr:ferrous iron transport protein A [Bacteroidota bacterium]
MMKLSQVAPGTTVRIVGFEKEEDALKLMEMGCLPGETVTMAFIAPLGDPVSIIVTGYQLSLRLEEAEKVQVEHL